MDDSSSTARHRHDRGGGSRSRYRVLSSFPRNAAAFYTWQALGRSSAGPTFSAVVIPIPAARAEWIQLRVAATVVVFRGPRPRVRIDTLVALVSSRPRPYSLTLREPGPSAGGPMPWLTVRYRLARLAQDACLQVQGPLVVIRAWFGGR